MLYEVFSVYDAAVDLYLPPFFMRSKQEAVRAIKTAVSDTTHEFHRNAEDYVLFSLGTYFEASAKFELLPNPERVCALLALKANLSKEV